MGKESSPWPRPPSPASISGLNFLNLKRVRFSFVVKSYLFGYLIVIGLWRVYSSRYLLPLIPFAAVFFFAGVGVLARRFSVKAWGVGGVLLVLLFALKPS